MSTDRRAEAQGVLSLYVIVCLAGVLITHLRQASAAQTCWQPHGAAIKAQVSHVWQNKGCSNSNSTVSACVSVKMNEDLFCFFSSGAALLVEVLNPISGTIAVSGVT